MHAGARAGGWRRVAAGVALLALLAGCGGERHEPPVAIVKGDTCAVCGMDIGPYPGPRAEAYVAGLKEPLRFGGTRDFFAYVTQPDVATRLETLYVQDCARIDWAHPNGAVESFVDARTAYYVGWQPLAGEMGPTFAAFAKPEDAQAFIRAHGGALLRFEQITPQLVSALGHACPTDGSALARLAPDCAQPKAQAPRSPK